MSLIKLTCGCVAFAELDLGPRYVGKRFIVVKACNREIECTSSAGHLGRVHGCRVRVGVPGDEALTAQETYDLIEELDGLIAGGYRLREIMGADFLNFAPSHT